MDNKIRVEVIYIDAEDEFIQLLDLPSGAILELAIHESGLLLRYPHLSVNELAVGIFNTPAQLNTHLHDGDRVEIYKQLLLDPMQARRLRADTPSA